MELRTTLEFKTDNQRIWEKRGDSYQEANDISMKSVEGGKEPLKHFIILTTSLFQCALHTLRSSMQSQDWASQGKTWLLHWWQLYQKCPSLHYKIYLASLYSCFWGWKVFQFYDEMDTKMVFLTRKWRQAVPDKQELCEAQSLCDVCPKWEDLYLHLKARKTQKMSRKGQFPQREQKSPLTVILKDCKIL